MTRAQTPPDDDSITASDVPLALHMICCFIQDALIVDYYVVRPVVFSVFSKKSGHYGIEFDSDPDIDGDIAGVETFLKDFDAALAIVEAGEKRGAMLNGNIHEGKDGNGIYVTNLEDIVTILRVVSDTEHMGWTHPVETHPAKGPNSDADIQVMNQNHGNATLFNMRATGPYTSHSAMLADLTRSQNTLRHLGHFGRRFTLDDLDSFMAEHYKTHMPTGNYLIDRGAAKNNGGTTETFNAMLADQKNVPDDAQTPFDAGDNTNGMDLEPIPDVVLSLSDFIEDVLYANYNVEAPDVEIGYQEGRIAFHLTFIASDDPGCNDNALIGLQLLGSHFQEAIIALADLIHNKKIDQKALDIDYDPEHGILTSDSLESILFVLTRISDTYECGWDKGIAELSPLQGDIIMDNEKRQHAENILCNDETILAEMNAFDGFVSRDELLKDVLRRAAFYKDHDPVTRPTHTLSELERLIATHNMQNGIDKPSPFKTGIWPQ